MFCGPHEHRLTSHHGVWFHKRLWSDGGFQDDLFSHAPNKANHDDRLFLTKPSQYEDFRTCVQFFDAHEEKPFQSARWQSHQFQLPCIPYLQYIYYDCWYIIDHNSSYSLGLLLLLFFLTLSSWAAFWNSSLFFSSSALISSKIYDYYWLNSTVCSVIFFNFSCSYWQSLFSKLSLSYPLYIALFDLTFPKRFIIDDDSSLPTNLAYF